jgi:hypothetical protein
MRWSWASCESPGHKFSASFVRRNDDPGTRGFTVHKFETGWIRSLAKESLALPDNNRKNQQVHLIDKIMLSQCLNEVAAAMNLQLRRVQFFEPGDLF